MNATSTLLLGAVGLGVSARATTVFAPGEAGIMCWRIPAIVDATRAPAAATTGATAGQTLLAFAEARIKTCGDDTEKMMAMKRSTDGGHSWGVPQFIVGDNATRVSSVWNPEPVVDVTTGTVFLAYLVNRTNCLARPGHCAAYMISSSDAATQNTPTWSAPQRLDSALGIYANGVRPGPGRALQLDVGPHAGRLLWSGSYDQIDPKPPNQHTLDIVWYSDDQGKTFTLAPSQVVDGDESSLVQLANGTLLMSIRPALASKCKCRQVARSEDYGVTWGKMMDVPDLSSPRCQGSMVCPPLLHALLPRSRIDHCQLKAVRCAVAQVRPTGQSAVFFSNPSSTVGRVNMTVRRSDDGGETFPRYMYLSIATVLRLIDLCDQ
jgi:sialidase-1